MKSKNHLGIMSGVNLKLKYGKGDHLRGSYDIDRLQDENLRETLQGESNIKLEGLKFQSVQDKWNNLRKNVGEAADGFLARMVGNAARINGIVACVQQERRRFYKNYLSDRLYENKGNVRKVKSA